VRWTCPPSPPRGDATVTRWSDVRNGVFRGGGIRGQMSGGNVRSADIAACEAGSDETVVGARD